MNDDKSFLLFGSPYLDVGFCSNYRLDAVIRQFTGVQDALAPLEPSSCACAHETGIQVHDGQRSMDGPKHAGKTQASKVLYTRVYMALPLVKSPFSGVRPPIRAHVLASPPF